jgi:hypothetical protein
MFIELSDPKPNSLPRDAEHIGDIMGVKGTQKGKPDGQAFLIGIPVWRFPDPNHQFLRV